MYLLLKVLLSLTCTPLSIGPALLQEDIKLPPQPLVATFLLPQMCVMWRRQKGETTDVISLRLRRMQQDNQERELLLPSLPCPGSYRLLLPLYFASFPSPSLSAMHRTHHTLLFEQDHPRSQFLPREERENFRGLIHSSLKYG